VTSLEYSLDFAVRLKHRTFADSPDVVQGDASSLPFPERCFSSVVAILVIHHLRSSELQDLAFAECYRVLKPAGIFVAFEINDGWFNRALHTHSTFVPLATSALTHRLTTAGFSKVSIEARPAGFRTIAMRGI
jgi:ubiquinone/menaquinone biosynthesis C-methylase UbiE